jgi:hypothetical protein
MRLTSKDLWPAASGFLTILGGICLVLAHDLSRIRVAKTKFSP